LSRGGELILELAVDVAQLEAFLVIAEELHFGRAAQRLHVSQPRVSRLIASLERQVGGRLFERTSRKVTLTPLGEQLRDELGAAYTQMLAALDHARRTARRQPGSCESGSPTPPGARRSLAW
jgi:DNA-binding transcriptional LysR family regulator